MHDEAIFAPLTTARLLTLLAAIGLFLLASHPGFAETFSDDPVRYDFPDGVPVSDSLEAEQRYLAARQDMVQAGSAIDESDSGMPVGVYEDIGRQFSETAAAYPDDPVQHYCRRRLLLLDWMAENASGSETAGALLDLADRCADQDCANMTRQFAMLVYLRVKEMEKASSILKGLSPEHAPKFAYFLYQYGRYFAMYGEEFSERQVSGQPDEEDYRRRRFYAHELESVLLPKVESYVKMAGSLDLGGIERDNVALHFKRMASDMSDVLGGRLYMDLSKTLTEELMPRALSAWSDSLYLLDPDQGCFHTKEEMLSEIQIYEEKVLPHIRDLQQARQFNLDFGPLMRESRKKARESAEKAILGHEGLGDPGPDGDGLLAEKPGPGSKQTDGGSEKSRELVSEDSNPAPGSGLFYRFLLLLIVCGFCAGGIFLWKRLRCR